MKMPAPLSIRQGFPASPNPAVIVRSALAAVIAIFHSACEKPGGESNKSASAPAAVVPPAPGAGVFLDKLVPESAGERYLTGYASRLAESEPARAVSEYKELRLGRCSMYGLLDVMERLTPDGDFPAADALKRKTTTRP